MMETRRGKKRKGLSAFWLIILTVAVLVGLYFCLVLNRTFSQTEYNGDAALKVATLNAHMFRHTGSQKETLAILRQRMKDYDIDIIQCQEVPEGNDNFDALLSETLGQDFPYIEKCGELALLSKIPIVSSEKKKFPAVEQTYMSSILKCGEKGEFKLINCHLETTGIANINMYDISSIMAIKELLTGNNKARRYQAKMIGEDVKNSNCPVMLTGDFNALPFSGIYNSIKGGKLKDAFLKAGTGKGSTYRFKKDFLRIDYIMASDDFEFCACKVDDSYLSDHRMVIASINIK